MKKQSNKKRNRNRRHKRNRRPVAHREVPAGPPEENQVRQDAPAAQPEVAEDDQAPRRSEVVSQSHGGSLPSAQEVEQHEGILPSAADQNAQMAEAQSKREKASWLAAPRVIAVAQKVGWGGVLAILILGACGVGLWLGYESFAIRAATVTVALLVAVYVLGVEAQEMNAPFHAVRIHDAAGDCRLERVNLDALSPGEVVVQVEWSSVNYKDALAATGKAPIASGFPRVGGIDLAGRVVHSAHPDWSAGAAVLAHGCGIGERHDGGYAEYARLPADYLVPMPDGMDARRAMALGTAGFTVALCLKRFEDNGQRPEQGPIAVTGATGGVGSLAVALLAGLGYEVHAITGKDGAAEYLHALGAHAVHDRRRLDLGTRPLEKTRWAGAIDNLGGAMLSWLTRTVEPLGEHRQRRFSRRQHARHHGDALYPARRRAARRDLRELPNRAAPRTLAAAGRRVGTAKPGAYRHAHGPTGRTHRGVPAVHRRGYHGGAYWCAARTDAAAAAPARGHVRGAGRGVGIAVNSPGGMGK